MASYEQKAKCGRFGTSVGFSLDKFSIAQPFSYKYTHAQYSLYFIGSADPRANTTLSVWVCICVWMCVRLYGKCIHTSGLTSIFVTWISTLLWFGHFVLVWPYFKSTHTESNKTETLLNRIATAAVAVPSNVWSRKSFARIFFSMFV